MNPHMNKKLIYLVAAGIAIVGVAVLIFTRDKTPEYQTAVAKKGKIVSGVTATGKVKPAQDLNLNFQIQGRVARININVGDTVSAGQELARLDINESSIQLTEAQANLDVAKARLAQVKAGSSAQEIAIAQTTLD